MKIGNWLPEEVGSNEAQLRKRFPDLLLRVWRTQYAPGVEVSETSIEGSFFVEAGRALFRSAEREVELSAGMFVEFPGGEFHVTTLGESNCTIIKIWEIWKIIAEESRHRTPVKPVANKADRFEFTDTPTLDSQAFVVRVPACLRGEMALFQAFHERAGFIDFGFNWNAMWDCLGDFTSVDQQEIILVHTDVPELPPDRLRIYVDLLSDAVAEWAPGEKHTLRVIFPASARAQIESVG